MAKQQNRTVQVAIAGRDYLVTWDADGQPIRVRVSVQPESAQAAYWRRIWSTGQCRDITAAAQRAINAAV